MAESTLYWHQLTEILEQFIAAWETEQSPPEIRNYLPRAIDDSWKGIAAELIKVDMEYRFKMDQYRFLDSYIALIPEIVVEGCPPYELVYEELHYRRLASEKSDRLKNPENQLYATDYAEQYLERYPQYQTALKKILLGTEYTTSTAVTHLVPKKNFQAGEVVDDFQLVQLLGEGAFGQVFLAKQLSMQRIVALKITTRRSNEPETLAQLEHPSIVRVYDQRRDAQNDVWLLYMQFAPGGTLKEVVERVRQTPIEKRTGTMLLNSVNDSLMSVGYTQIESISLKQKISQSDWPEIVCRIGIQLALALDFAHNRGVLHRDIKPANVLLSAECLPKLADFNISYASTLQGSDAEAFFGGSLAYMSPEQLEAFNPELDMKASMLDGRTDLYSLCAMLWELLYGVRPFSESDLTVHQSRMLRQLVVRRKVLPKASEYAIDSLSKRLTNVLLSGLEPERDARPRDGQSLARSFWYCLDPDAKKLIELPNHGWRRIAAKWPLLATTLVVLVPNGFAGWFNYEYNLSHIVKMGEHAHSAFQWVSTLLNIIYFSGGFFLVVCILGPITKQVRCSERNMRVHRPRSNSSCPPQVESLTHQGEKNDAALSSMHGSLSITSEPRGDTAANTVEAGKEIHNPSVVMRQSCLKLGQIATLVGIAMWLSSGILFPISISLAIGRFEWNMYLHFLSSMTVCGLIAAAYPFFGLSYLSTRVFFPVLLGTNTGTDEDKESLQKLEQSLSMPFFAAAFVPLASTLTVVLLDYSNKLVATTLIVAGLIGLSIVYFLYQRVRINVSILLRLLNPLHGISTEGQLAK